MRPVLHGDVVAAARALLPIPEHCRPDAMRQMLEQAAAADRYCKRLGRAHPEWGNGSLMGMALLCDKMPEPFLDDPEYCRCLMLVFSSLLDWRGERAVFSQKRRICNLAPSGPVQVV